MFRFVKAWAATVLVLAVLFGALSGALAGNTTELLDLVNEERSAAGLKNLSLSEDLNRVAQLRAAEIVKNWSHTRPNGEEWKTAFSDAGVSASYRGENLAKGQYSAELVVDDWMASDGHRDNILNKKFTKMGVASVVIDGVTYWVQVFANEVKPAKKTSASNSGANGAQASESGAAATAPAPAGNTQGTGNSNSNQTGALDKLPSTLDVQAALNAPPVIPTLGKNPGL